MVPVGCPEMLVTFYKSTLCNSEALTIPDYL